LTSAFVFPDDALVGWRASVSRVAIASALSVGCSGDLVKLAPLPPASYERLGRVEGTGCGSLGLLDPGWYVIPMGLGGRIERARAKALEQKPGATGLVDVRVTEYWFWWVIATTRCTTVTGEAIR
jgi:hypothetical protein